jgi:adenylylsulfate kinase-like enzyme
MRILITGLPASGKSTLIKALQVADRDDVRAESLDDYGYHPAGKKSEWIVDVEEIARLAQESEEAGIHFIAGGVASNVAEWFELDWEHIILLEVHPETILVDRARREPQHWRGDTMDEAVKTGKTGKLAHSQSNLKQDATDVLDGTLPVKELADQVLDMLSQTEITEEEPHGNVVE